MTGVDRSIEQDTHRNALCIIGNNAVENRNGCCCGGGSGGRVDQVRAVGSSVALDAALASCSIHVGIPAHTFRSSGVGEQEAISASAAVWLTWTIKARAVGATEARIACTDWELRRGGPHTLSKARAVVRAIKLLAVGAAPTRLASAVASVCALDATIHACEARVTHADTRVHGNLIAVDAGSLTGLAHPALLALCADRWVNGSVTNAAIVAVGSAWAVWDLAALATPAFVAEALLLCTVAGTVATAALANARATLDLAEGTPPGRVALACAIHTRPVATALAVAAKTVVAGSWVARANTRVHGLLNAVHARNLTNLTHPSGRAIDAHGGIHRAIAVSTTVAIGLTGAVRDVAARAGPARLA